MAIKFERENGLNSKGQEVLKAFEQYLKADADLKPMLSFYIEKNLKFELDTLSKFKDKNDLENYLLHTTAYTLSEKEKIESSKDFAAKILDLDRLKASTKTDARKKCLTVFHSVGIKKSDCEIIFDKEKWIPSNFNNGFVEKFVDFYVRKNVIRYLSAITPDKYTITLSDVYQSQFGYWNIDIQFNIKIDDLDDEVLTEIGKILVSLPSFC